MDYTRHIFLDSQDRIPGSSTTNASFDLKTIDDELYKGSSAGLDVSLQDFVLATSNVSNASGIVRVHLADTVCPYSDDVLGTFETQGQKYPPAALTGTVTTLSGLAYGNGSYVATFSPGGNWQNTFAVFDMSPSDAGTRFTYNENTGLPNPGSPVTTATNGQSYTGQWIDLRLPEAIVPLGYVVKSGGDQAKRVTQFSMLGSSDGGTTWVHLHSRPYASIDSSQFVFYPAATAQEAFQTYRLVLERAGNMGWSSYRDFCVIDEWYVVRAPVRAGQCHLIRSDVTVLDSSFLKRPLTLRLSSPNGANLSALGEWSAHLTVRKRGSP